MATTAKIFVLDTNVLLHDHKCIDYFQDNDIVIPIVALEELDKFKKGNETINYHAREFARDLDRLSGDNLFGEGVSRVWDEVSSVLLRVNPFRRK